MKTPSDPMRTIHVDVVFRGTVGVSVPAELIDGDAKLLAEHVALSRMLATVENVDAPDEDALADYQDACTTDAAVTAETDWDVVRLFNPTGAWTLAEPSAEECRNRR